MHVYLEPVVLNYTNPYEYYLGFWGEVQNDHLIEKELGIKETHFWFKSRVDRGELKGKLAAVANRHGVIIAFKEEEGYKVRLRTIARMSLVMPNGKAYLCERDLGYSYDFESARFYFMEGNFSCDCNRSLLIAEKYPEVKPMDCGDEIQIKEFSLNLEA